MFSPPTGPGFGFGPRAGGVSAGFCATGFGRAACVRGGVFTGSGFGGAGFGGSGATVTGAEVTTGSGGPCTWGGGETSVTRNCSNCGIVFSRTPASTNNATSARCSATDAYRKRGGRLVRCRRRRVPQLDGGGSAVGWGPSSTGPPARGIGNLTSS